MVLCGCLVLSFCFFFVVVCYVLTVFFFVIGVNIVMCVRIMSRIAFFWRVALICSR